MTKISNQYSLTNVLTADAVNGRVGIGTASPVSALQAVGAIRASNSGNTVSTRIESDGIYTSGSDMFVDGGTSNIRFYSTSERMRITSTGNVGIGTSSPGGKLQINNTSTQYVVYTSSGNIEVYQPETTASGTQVRLGSAYNLPGVYSNGQLNLNSDSGNAIAFNTNGNSEKMRITSGGNVLMGTSSDNGYRLRVSGGMYANSIYLQQPQASGGGTLTLANNDTFADSGALIGQVNFYNTDADIPGTAAYMRAYAGANYGVGGQLGFGTQNTYPSGTLNQRLFIDNAGNIGAPSGTNIYNASDARLKRNVVPIESGLDKVMQLNPVKFNWIEKFVESEENKDMLGFIAQEVLPHIPEAIESFGESDLYIDGVVIEKPLRINEKFIIPVIVKAIQEQQTQINELKALLNA